MSLFKYNCKWIIFYMPWSSVVRRISLEIVSGIGFFFFHTTITMTIMMITAAHGKDMARMSPVFELGFGGSGSGSGPGWWEGLNVLYQQSSLSIRSYEKEKGVSGVDVTVNEHEFERVTVWEWSKVQLLIVIVIEESSGTKISW